MNESRLYEHPGIAMGNSPAETFRRAVKPGHEFNHLFPCADMKETTVKKGASVTDTVRFIPQVVAQTRWMTEKLSAHLQRSTLRETCRAIWEWCYAHITYAKDEKNKEQIRSPARVWADRFRGIDCDCFTTFISTILTNLSIPHVYRITRYKASSWEHIYPIVPTEGGYHITMDCVAPRFDFEVVPTELKDFNMELTFLSGLSDTSPYGDSHLLDEGDGLSDLGRLFKKKMKAKAAKADTTGKRLPASATPKRKGKGLFIFNRINPAAALLRNGFLASMKLNMKRVAERLRWTYLPEAEAVRRGMDAGRYRQYVQTRQKLDNLFYKAGGKPDNLRKAILTGKGNRDKAVNGLGYADEYMDSTTPLPQLLGMEIYADENAGVLYGYRDQRVDYILNGLGLGGLHGMGALGELGEPATATGVAAVAAIIAGIATTLDKIGEIFPGKKGNDAAVPADTGADTSGPKSADNAPVIVKAADTEKAQSLPNAASASESNTLIPQVKEAFVAADKESPAEQYLPESTTKAEPGQATPTASNNTPDKQSWWTKNKKWALPAAIGTGAVLTGFVLMRSTKKAKAGGGGGGLGGLPKGGKKNHHRKPKKRSTRGKLQTIRLL
jgi:hypothetical protein